MSAITCKHGTTKYCFACVREQHNQDELDGRFDVEEEQPQPPQPEAPERNGSVVDLMVGTCAVGHLDCSLIEFVRGLKYFIDQEARGVRCDTHLINTLRRAACVAWELEQAWLRADLAAERPADEDERVKEIRAKQPQRRRELNFAGWSQAAADIDYLLSLLDRQQVVRSESVGE